LCFFFVGFTFLEVVLLLCRLYLSGCRAFSGFTFSFACKIGIFYGSAGVGQEKMTTDLEIMDFGIRILIMPKWTRSNS